MWVRCHGLAGWLLLLLHHETILGVFSVEQVLFAPVRLFKLLLRAQHYVIVVLHLAEAREHWNANVTVPIDAVNRERLSHFLIKYLKTFNQLLIN